MAMIAFSFIPASFAIFVVKERECKAKHQQVCVCMCVCVYVCVCVWGGNILLIWSLLLAVQCALMYSYHWWL